MSNFNDLPAAAGAAPAAGAPGRDGARWTAATAVLTVAFLTAALGYGRVRYGSVSAALAYVSGDRLMADEPFKALAGVKPGERVTVPYAVTNLSGRPVTILGARTSCTCAVVNDLPVAIPPDQTRVIKVEANAPPEGGFSSAVVFYTDDPQNREVRLGFSGHVTPATTRPRPR